MTNRIYAQSHESLETSSVIEIICFKFQNYDRCESLLEENIMSFTFKTAVVLADSLIEMNIIYITKQRKEYI